MALLDLGGVRTRKFLRILVLAPELAKGVSSVFAPLLEQMALLVIVRPDLKGIDDLGAEHDEQLSLHPVRRFTTKDVPKPEDPRRQIFETRYARARGGLLVQQQHLRGRLISVDNRPGRGRVRVGVLHSNVQMNELHLGGAGQRIGI